ncbi:MAG: hypothetical protein MUC83_08250 [Pirellula sp.]|jgi:hypothetical protein|nr:hypothetical protein [Pirellula sp.]
MENSRRSKKRSKFFWPEIGLLILGVLGFKPEILYDILGFSNQSAYGTARPLIQQQPTSQQPLTSNPLLAWGVQAIQSAASQTTGGLPTATPPYGQTLQPQPPYYTNQATAQNPPYQPPLNYGSYGNFQYQSAPTAPGYSYPNPNWAASNNGNSFIPTAAANLQGPGFANRVPPADYQNTPASYPTPLRSTAPFPSTNTSAPTNNAAYGNTYGTNVRKEGTGYDDPRINFAQLNQAQLYEPQYSMQHYQSALATNNQFPYAPTAYGAPLPNSQPSYAPFATAQTPAYWNQTNQTLPHSQDQYFWGATDPRVNNQPRPGTAGSWVPNVPAFNQGAGRVGRY